MPVTEGIFNKSLTQLIKILIIVLLLAVLNSFLQVFVIFINQEIQKYQSQIEILEKEISRTKVEMASLESFERIQTIALNKLGMRAANSDDYHWVEAMPVVSESLSSIPDQASPEIVEADLWEQLSRWIGNIGKTMAQSL
ncbi:MAG: hypothetical protein ACM3YE_04350 [Bacteroidota bacterium]